jgi:agmatine/peptidylarginine deiminase
VAQKGIAQLPVALSYRLPAEWERHEATWIGWQHNLTAWPGKFAPIPWVYSEIVRRIIPGEIAVLVPTFNDPQDRIALGTLVELFPDRPVLGIHAVDLVWGLGTLHCLTQQQPAL